ncbi:MAG TPA: PRC-barrel domain-containing protein [Xanthobacteraceae bacterium]|nr:PRC-barrel domain-containing protein [Xanthobacteraceae bacterium]
MKSDAPKPSASDAMKADTPKPAASASTSGASGSAATISSQKPDQLLASKVKGADVLGSDDKKIGDVSDILFSKDGKIEAYILSVGGFLGVGAKEVALAPSSIQMTQDKDTWKLKVSMTKDQLAQAPNFERYQDRSTTTGAGSGASSSGSGSATTPRSAPGGAMAPSGSGSSAK